MAFIECNHSSGLCLGYLLCTKIVEETWKHMIAFSNLYHRLCYRNLASSIGNDNDPFVPHIQSHECYRSSRVSWQGISPRTTDLVVPEYSGPSTRTVKIKTKCIKNILQWKQIRYVHIRHSAHASYCLNSTQCIPGNIDTIRFCPAVLWLYHQLSINILLIPQLHETTLSQHAIIWCRNDR